MKPIFNCSKHGMMPFLIMAMLLAGCSCGGPTPNVNDTKTDSTVAPVPAIKDSTRKDSLPAIDTNVKKRPDDRNTIKIK